MNASNAGENAHMSMRWRISDVVGSGVSCLYDSIPSLRTFMDDGTEVDRSEGRKIAGNSLDQRLKYMFCKLISAIPCRSQPLVLVLDDLQVSACLCFRIYMVFGLPICICWRCVSARTHIQWADEMTLGVIRMLMTDPEIHYFLLLGCYRENEVNESHILSTNLNVIREQGINIMTIKVGAIEKESTNALISDVMCLPPNLCRPLWVVESRKSRHAYTCSNFVLVILILLISAVWFPPDQT